MILEYSIRNRQTKKYYETREIEFSVEDVLDGVRDRLSAPIHMDMENEYEFYNFEIVVKGISIS